MTFAQRRLTLALLLSGAAHTLLLGSTGPMVWPQPTHPESGPLSLQLLPPRPTEQSHATAPETPPVAPPVAPVTPRTRPERPQRPARAEPAPVQTVAAPAPQATRPAPAPTPAADETSAATEQPSAPSGDTATVTAAAAEATGPTPEARQAVRAQLEQELARHFHYPLLARRLGWEGEVRLGLHIDPQGRVSAAHIINGSGHELLDRAALEAIGKVVRLAGVAGWLAGHDLQLELPIIYQLRES